MRPCFHDREASIRSIEGLIRGTDADLLVLPELCTTGYVFSSHEELRSLAEPVPGGITTRALAVLARETNTSLVIGLAELHGNKVYNASVLIDRSGAVVTPTYRKLHLFWDEKDLFTPGDRPPLVHRGERVPVGLMVCFDWAFPEVPRSLALQGADIICHSANLVLPFAQGAAVTRAIENRVFVILANRVGEERQGETCLRFTGQSRVVDPKGRILIESDDTAEEMRVVEIDPALARDKMITPRNHVLEDRRPEMYAGLI